MFLLNPPRVRETEVHARMPAHYRRPGVRTVWADANRGGHSVDSFLEGPVFGDDGSLYVTDIPFGRIFRITSGLEWELVAEYDGEPNGMKFLDAGHLIITDYRNGLMVLDIARGSVDAFLERRNSERFKGVNDLVFDSHGNLYFTDQGQTGLHDPSGRVYRLTPAGKLDLLLSNAPSPNGLVLSVDERFLFVAMTRGNCVWRMPLFPDGSVGKAGQFFTSYGPSGPDGMAMDEAGRLIVCNPGLGWAWVLNGRAEPVEILRSATEASLTNVAFGGPERRIAYFTESVSGTILRAQMAESGCSLHRRSTPST
jgi:gluconolactonase